MGGESSRACSSCGVILLASNMMEHEGRCKKIIVIDTLPDSTTIKACYMGQNENCEAMLNALTNNSGRSLTN
jgi:hypothetical protein